MTSEEYEQMVEDAHSIPIIEVGALVVTGFEYYNSKPTGQCCKHVDNKKGNFSFNTNRNYAKCFTCGEAFTTINLVKAYKGLGFKDAILFLYNNFPTYFTQEPYGGEFVPAIENWDGLTNKEYMYIKVPTRLTIAEKTLSISEFAKEHPFEHDIMLVEKIIDYRNYIEKIHTILLFDKKLDKKTIEQNYKDIYTNFKNLLTKGLRNKELLPKTGKINLKVLLNSLKDNQSKYDISRKNNR